jgi:hypothetical protein
MTMKTNTLEPEDILNMRRTVTLAEAILTICLGALHSPCSHLQSQRPCRPYTLDCTPWSSHNRLTLDVVEPTRRISDAETTDAEVLGPDDTSALDKVDGLEPADNSDKANSPDFRSTD